MYTADWLLFYDRGRARLSWPFLSALFPLGYLAFVFIHGAFLKFDTSILNYTGSDPMVYPYFFLNPERVGVVGVVMWCFGLLAAFIAGGFLFMGADRLLGKLQRS